MKSINTVFFTLIVSQTTVVAVGAEPKLDLKDIEEKPAYIGVKSVQGELNIVYKGKMYGLETLSKDNTLPKDKKKTEPALDTETFHPIPSGKPIYFSQYITWSDDEYEYYCTGGIYLKPEAGIRYHGESYREGSRCHLMIYRDAPDHISGLQLEKNVYLPVQKKRP